jgi:hypothetical protein
MYHVLINNGDNEQDYSRDKSWSYQEVSLFSL